MSVAIGQSAKRFLSQESSKPLVLGGVHIPEHEGLMGVSDGDVILHAIGQALSSIMGYPVYTQITSDLIEKDGITDSLVFLERCLAAVYPKKISYVSLSLEAKSGLLGPYMDKIQNNIAGLLGLDKDQVGLSLFEASGLTDISCGDGIGVMAALTLQGLF